ncbi:hypothetical protein [Glaciimonas soli]|uniref:DUF2917 domain-containing protein n=1 Tax=Glaciimonas soli TaxID=2590999 RepID=A0A843YUD2_9BURK|nr:hypothetical protein [Glaciimonas soli]MQR01108.1 hypothetical protein [Glaciimonas soli]
MSTFANMPAKSAKSGQTLHFYSAADTVITLQSGKLRINLDSRQMDGYHWREIVTLTENGQWVAPRSGWMQVDVMSDATLQITAPLSVWRGWDKIRDAGAEWVRHFLPARY